MRAVSIDTIYICLMEATAEVYNVVYEPTNSNKILPE